MDKLFAFHKLNQEGQDTALALAYLYTNLLHELERVCAIDSREFSIAKTKLEEACFFSKKAVAIQAKYQVSETVQTTQN